MKTKILKLFSILFIFSLFSCSNLFEQVDVKNSSSDVSVSFNFGNSRAIVSTAEPEKYKYTLEGTIGEETKTLCDKIAYSEFISKKFEVSKGEWTFKITAWDNDKAVYSDEKSVNLNSSNTTVSFTLRALIGGTGSVSIKLTYDQSADVKKVTAGIYDDLFAADTGSQLTIDTSDFSATFTADSIPSGVNKFVRFFLYDSQNVCIGSYVESIFIANGDSITVTRNVAVNSYSAVVYVKVQGNNWIDSGCKIKVLKDGKSYEFLTTAGTNVYTASLSIGTYDIYNDSEDTGVDLTVGGDSTAKATVDFEAIQVNATVDNFAEVVNSLTCEAKIIVTGNVDTTAMNKLHSALQNRWGNGIILDLSNCVFSEDVTLNFWWCDSLKEILLPASLRQINPAAFYECDNLKKINVDANSQYFSSDNGILFNKDKTCLICYPPAKTETSYTIPASITDIERAFSNCRYLKEVIIQASLNEIGTMCFADCHNLESINIPSSVTEIGQSAFYRCRNLKAVELPSSLKTIGSNAFVECDSLTSITIPSSVDTIIDYAFYSCKGLQSVIINGPITKIDTYTFGECKKLVSIIIPATVETIYIDAFTGCTNLEAINIQTGNQNYTSDNGVLFNIDKTKLLLYPAGKKDTSYTIPASVKEIGNNAFMANSYLQTVDFSSVETINKEALSNCSALTSIELPDSVTEIKDHAFAGCTNLETVKLPKNLQIINESVFQSDSKLSTVVLPEKLEKIASEAFFYCTSLESISLPASVISIHPYAFYNTQALKQIIVDADNENYSSNDGILYNKDQTVLLHYPAGRSDTSYIVADTVTGLGKLAFCWCLNLTSVTIPSSVKEMEQYPFNESENLTSIVFNDPYNWSYKSLWGEETTVDLSNSSENVTYFLRTYNNGSWVKKTE